MDREKVSPFEGYQSYWTLCCLIRGQKSTCTKYCKYYANLFTGTSVIDSKLLMALSVDRQRSPSRVTRISLVKYLRTIDCANITNYIILTGCCTWNKIGVIKKSGIGLFKFGKSKLLHNKRDKNGIPNGV